jgi:VCBS repeat-containing protein
MRILRQSTSVDLPIGPFLDSVDGVTAKTALSITQPDIRLKKNAANWAQKNAAQTLAHEENGYYEVTLDATDTNTLGQMRLACVKSTACPIWDDFLIVTANVWDTLCSTGKFDVNAASFTAGALTSAAFGAGAINAAAIATDAITAAKVADGTIDAATFAANAITSSVLATDAIGSAQLAAGAGTEIAAAIKALVIETAGSYTLGQALSIMLAVLAGRTSSSGATISTPDGSATRVAATIDGSNNRTGMTLTPST